ncbi:anthranilate synthase component I family protein [Alteribacillus sp. HJP-4]|uniref:anthranilate synthase component I family protein n=1 Tax=Alteribacillus sp. HJP-4 TaxID=2775394 RepID=UPI0035CCDA86
MPKNFCPLPDRAASYEITGVSFTYNADDFFYAYRSLSQGESRHAILESGQRGRYSIAAFCPFAELRGKDDSLFIETAAGQFEKRGEPLEEMKTWLSPYTITAKPALPDFQSGLIGFFSYDYVRRNERLPHLAEDDLDTPDFCFLAFQEVFVYDHLKETLWILIHHAKGRKAEALLRAEEWKKKWLEPRAFEWCWNSEENTSIANQNKMKPSFSQAAFSRAVEKVQHYIRSGDVFQVNLSVRESEPLRTPPLHIYEKLRELNPSPYMGYIHTPWQQIINGSPELLVKKRGAEASTRPIAGTRPRGKTEAEDTALEKELFGTEKERAEHIMLVDLERNDLGRVCKYGSVEVDELMVTEKYSHVMHIVSNVKGILADQVDGYDMIKAAFPGGTITGAPKIRTMEIIEELEPVRRGLYTGSIGWIGFDGDLELNIVIRTMIAKERAAYVQAGAGIVIDSKPAAEYEESLRKARALWKAKESSEAEFIFQKQQS